MQTMTLHVQDGEVIFHCAGCARDFAVDPTRPFVPQLREISYGHHCRAWSPLDEPDTVLSSMTGGSWSSDELPAGGQVG